MVGRGQEIADPNTKHPGNEIADYDDPIVAGNVFLAVVAMAVFMLILYFLGGANVIH